MPYYKKYLLYKRLMQIALFLNALIFAGAIVLGVSFVNKREAIDVAIETQVRNLKAIDVMENKDDRHKEIIGMEEVFRQDIRELVFQHEEASERLIWLAVLTLLFGILLPAMAFYQLSHSLRDIRVQAEEQLTVWLAEFLKNYSKQKENSTSPFYERPTFWINILLASTEAFGHQSKNPFFAYIGEIAPIIRSELAKSDLEKIKNAS